MLIDEIYKNPNSLDLTQIHKLFVENNFKDRIPPKGTTVFSLFSEDIESYRLPSSE